MTKKQSSIQKKSRIETAADHVRFASKYNATVHAALVLAEEENFTFNEACVMIVPQLMGRINVLERRIILMEKQTPSASTPQSDARSPRESSK